MSVRSCCLRPERVLRVQLGVFVRPISRRGHNDGRFRCGARDRMYGDRIRIGRGGSLVDCSRCIDSGYLSGLDRSP